MLLRFLLVCINLLTASSSEGLLGLGSQVKLRPSMPWLSDWKSGVCRLKGSRSGLSTIGHLL